jgi:hypothetical protein
MFPALLVLPSHHVAAMVFILFGKWGVPLLSLKIGRDTAKY